MRAFLDAPVPSPAADARALPYLVLDLETTGLHPRSDAIVSLGWVPITNGRIALSGARHLPLALRRSVHESATVHHLRDADLAGGWPLKDALQHLLRALEGRVLVVHHAPLDVRFLDAACRQHLGAPLLVRVVDTLDLARRRQRSPGVDAEALRLGAVRAAHGLPAYPAHHALSDALATAELWLALQSVWAGAAPLPLRTVLRTL